MATSHQPLLQPPRSRNSLCKFLGVVVPLVAIAAAFGLLASTLINTAPSRSLLQTKVCDLAIDRESCIVILSEAASDGSMQKNSVDLLNALLRKTVPLVKEAIELASDAHSRINDPKERAALADCIELMNLSSDRLRDSMATLEDKSPYSRSNAHTWLSTVLTNHVTCLEGLTGRARSIMEPKIKDLIKRASTSLAAMVTVPRSRSNDFLPLRERFPSWVTIGDRKLLESSPNEIVANVMVAQDGSGDYKTVTEAVASAPNNSMSRYTILVKSGTYKENVQIGSKKKNIMLTGDGMNLTIITGSLNVVDGSTTFNSATVAAVGDGFIAQDIWFQNTAGPQKHQAVALRVGADQSIINRCRIDAYQDTLYAHSNRQFYRDSYITGTVDFTFGNAAVVFQNCQLVPRMPMANQGNMVTAQGRTDPNQNTGTSIQGCNIVASSDLEPVKNTIKSYLGRPWQQYSRTVVMQSNIGNFIDPAGWSIWSGDFALTTLYYGEYMNSGPGAGTSNRVNWTGYHVITSAVEASKFTVAQLIQGGPWLKDAGVTYSEGL